LVGVASGVLGVKAGTGRWDCPNGFNGLHGRTINLTNEVHNGYRIQILLMLSMGYVLISVKEGVLVHSILSYSSVIVRRHSKRQLVLEGLFAAAWHKTILCGYE
jgi:hypothetical protein